jgi:hypothetical protein
MTDSEQPEFADLDAHKELFVGASSARSGWDRIASEMGVGVGTIYRVALEGSKIREKVIYTPAAFRPGSSPKTVRFAR